MPLQAKADLKTHRYDVEGSRIAQWSENSFLESEVSCSNLGKGKKFFETNKKYSATIAYFDQRLHACACVRIVENDEKHWKMMKKVFSIIFDYVNTYASMRLLVKILLYNPVTSIETGKAP